MPSKESSLQVREDASDANSRPDSVMFVHNLVDEYGLDPYEFRIYAHAVRRTGGKLDGKYFASLNKTAEICQMSVRKAQYALKFLCEAGFLIQEKRKGRTDQYRITHSRQWANPEDFEAIRERVTGVKRKKPNNTSQSAKFKRSSSSTKKLNQTDEITSPMTASDASNSIP
jgi:hypothetical protein